MSAFLLQEEDLRQIFVLTVEVLQEFSRRDSLSAHMSSVFQRYLALANQVLSWNFLPPNHILCPWAAPWPARGRHGRSRDTLLSAGEARC